MQNPALQFTPLTEESDLLLELQMVYFGALKAMLFRRRIDHIKPLSSTTGRLCLYLYIAYL